jgi:hypothetical protein
MGFMNRRPFAFRAATLALAALFVVCQLVDGSGAHRCPMHDGVAGMVAGAEAHDSAAFHHAGHGDSGDDQQHDAPCTCLGACHGGSLALAATDVSPAAAVPPVAFAPLHAPGNRLPESPAHLLPFAIGPPHLV